MDGNEIYVKIPWIYKMPEFFENDMLSEVVLYRLPEKVQKFLVYKILDTLNKSFSQIPDSYQSDSDLDNYSHFIESLKKTGPTWVSGLCDLSVSQAINGLLDIINWKTEFKKFPPKSVMEFYGVCKRSRPVYDELKTSETFLRLENFCYPGENPENIDEIDANGRRLYDKRSGRKIQRHPVHGKRIFSIVLPMPQDKIWFSNLSPELKTKFYDVVCKSWRQFGSLLENCEEIWSFLDDGFESSCWFKPMVEAFREYYKIPKYKELT